MIYSCGYYFVILLLTKRNKILYYIHIDKLRVIYREVYHERRKHRL